MIEKILEKYAKYFYLKRFKKIEHDVGYKLVFHNIPKFYIDGLVSCEMTNTWQKFGLDIEKGANYFTMGHVVDGVSTRFDPNAPEYQSWLGGYTVKLKSGVSWTVEDHFKLAIADQNSWLKKWYGDPNPITTIEGRKFVPIEKIHIGQYVGQVYEFGCMTDDDVGKGYRSFTLKLASLWMAVFFNLSNSNLKLKGCELRPKISDNIYEKIEIPGYITIFDISENVKVVLYGNGVINKNINTFEILKNYILEAMKSCEIVVV